MINGRGCAKDLRLWGCKRIFLTKFCKKSEKRTENSPLLRGKIENFQLLGGSQWAIFIGHVDMTYFMLKSQFFHRNPSFYSSEIVTDEKKVKSKKKFL